MEKINIESFSGQTLFLQSMRIRRLLPQFHAPSLRISQGAIRSGWIAGLRQQ